MPRYDVIAAARITHNTMYSVHCIQTTCTSRFIRQGLGHSPDGTKRADISQLWLMWTFYRIWYTSEMDLRHATFYAMMMSTVLLWMLLYFKELYRCPFNELCKITYHCNVTTNKTYYKNHKRVIQYIDNWWINVHFAWAFACSLRKIAIVYATLLIL